MRFKENYIKEYFMGVYSLDIYCWLNIFIGVYIFLFNILNVLFKFGNYSCDLVNDFNKFYLN